MCKSIDRRPLFCIVPPHLLRAIAERGDPRSRKMALDALAIDGTLRTMRAVGTATAAVRRGAAVGGGRRTIYDARHTQRLPGTVVRREGERATKDAAVNEAYTGLGATYDFYATVFGRDSIDDQGLPLDATVHFGRSYDNAFWDGSQMVFGDGDGEYFSRFTVALDVIGHELTHGVTEDEAGLVYTGQSGALNESVSDVFGSLVRQYRRKQKATDADWLIGKGLFTKAVHGVALRSMKAPGTAYDDPILGKDPQPAHMKKYVHTMQDNGGVHINSGIPNHAFYAAAVGIEGYAWEKAGRVWYETLRDPRLKRTSSFQRFAGLTVLNAQRLFGATSSETKVVRDAWQQVGITA